MSINPYLDGTPLNEGIEMIAKAEKLCPPKNRYTYKRKEKKIGRNQPCPCGSGKKYKKCCDRKLTYKQWKEQEVTKQT